MCPPNCVESPSLPDEIQANNRLKHAIKCISDNLPISSDSVQRKTAHVVKHSQCFVGWHDVMSLHSWVSKFKHWKYCELSKDSRNQNGNNLDLKRNKSPIFRHLLLLTTQQEPLIVATTELTHSYPKMGRTFPVQSDLDWIFLFCLARTCGWRWWCWQQSHCMT